MFISSSGLMTKPIRSSGVYFQYFRPAIPNACSAGYDTANISIIPGIHRRHAEFARKGMLSLKLMFMTIVLGFCKVGITAKNAQALEAAERLASRAVHEV